MLLGVLQFELLIHGAESLKDKRRVVRSVKDRLHREHQVSVAEVDALDSLGRAVLGLAVVGREGERVAAVLDAITLKLRALTDAELGEVSREIIHGWGGAGTEGDVGGCEGDGPSADLTAELLERGRRAEHELDARRSTGDA